MDLMLQAYLQLVLADCQEHLRKLQDYLESTKKMLSKNDDTRIQAQKATIAALDGLLRAINWDTLSDQDDKAIKDFICAIL